MALYAIGDLHLSFQSDKTMDHFGKVWRNHERQLEKNCNKMISDEDILVLVGDHSWGRNLSECEKDLEFIQDLPGKKVMIRGNHDMFWDAKKTERLNEKFAGKLFFLQNNYASYQDYAIVGTKGYTFEGPFHMRGNKIVGWDGVAESVSVKRIERETERLKLSYLTSAARIRNPP